MIVSKIIVLFILVSLIVMIVLSLKKDVSKNEINREYINKNNINYNQQNNNISNYNQEKDNNDKIDKYYIMKTYGDELIYPLMGQRDKDRDVYSFYINKNNAMDIKLPYEFLSPIKTLESDKGHVLFELDVDDNYEHFLIHYDYSLPLSLGTPSQFNRWSNSNAYRHFSLLNYGGRIEYDFTHNYHIDKEKLKAKTESGEAMIKLIDTYNLHSESIIEYYIALIKKNQPTLDELIDILIKFEKAKEEIDKVKIINQSQTLNTMLENSVSHKDKQFDSIDKELMSLVNSNKKRQ